MLIRLCYTNVQQPAGHLAVVHLQFRDSSFHYPVRLLRHRPGRLQTRR